MGTITKYKLGQGWESDFDYKGMMETGLKLKPTDSLKKLEKLAYSMTDVNYHSVSAPLHQAINKLIKGETDVADLIEQFKENIRLELEEQTED